MPIPTVNIVQVNGALTSMPANILGDVAIAAGPAQSGDQLLPVAFMRPQDAIAYFTGGPLVEYGANLLQRSPGKPVVFVRTPASTDGAYGAIDVTHKSGASVITAHTATKPFDEYDVVVKVIAGGTVGVAGITYQWSLDGGTTWSPTTSLGTATTITITDGNVAFDLTAATLIAGDYWSCRSTPPSLTNQDLSDAEDCIGDAGLPWNWVGWSNPLTAAQIGLIDTWMQALWTTDKKHRASRGCVRGPNVGETEAQYLAAITAALSGVTSTFQSIAAGYCEFISACAGRRQYRRPASWITAVRALKVVRPSRTDLAQVDLGSLGADVRIRDLAGNRKAGLHDEAIDPGLDALSLETLCTLPGRGLAAYLTTPHILASVEDDRYLWQYRKVDNLVADVVQERLMLWARRPLEALKDGSGYISAREKSVIDADITKAVIDAAGDSVTDYGFSLNATDNILAKNAFLAGDSVLVPLGYPAGFSITQRFAQKVGG
jgi:hypothetical protein